MRVPYTDVSVKYMDTAQRRVLDLRADGLGNVVVLGRYAYSVAHSDLPVHHHTNVVEICFLERGSQVFEVNGREHHLQGGDMLVTMPGDPHSTAGQPSEPGILYWLNLQVPTTGKRLLGVPAVDVEPLLDGLRNLPCCCFRGNAQIKTLFDQLFELHDDPAIFLRTFRMRLAMFQLLVETVECARREPHLDVSRLMAEVIQLIKRRPEREFRLEELARLTGLSLGRFKVRFKAETGVSPRQFILRTKIEAAKKRLRSGMESISQIGIDLGFPTSQYFATVFRRFTGQTPKGFRQQSDQPKVASHRADDGQG